MTKKTIGKIEMPMPRPFSKIELMDRAYKQKGREIKIAKIRASVVRSQITNAYEILENIRFDFLGDTVFREYIVGAKRELEGAMSDFLLSDSYWEKRKEEHCNLTPQDYDKQQSYHSCSAKSKVK